MGYDRPAMASLLSCQEITKAYSDRPLFGHITLGIAEGERVGLVGPNGAGKSTLLKAISGLVTPSAGKIWFDGQDITNADAVTTSKLGNTMPADSALANVSREANSAGKRPRSTHWGRSTPFTITVAWSGVRKGQKDLSS